jgi:TonB family protein
MQLDRSLCHASLFVAWLAAFPTAGPLAAQESLQVVKDLYASAAYEDALSAVAKIDVTAPNPEAEQYRVLCLVALGRLDEADRAVEAILTAHPDHRPDAAEASPRIQALFAQVRRRIGPALVKRMYQRGKAALDRKDREDAIVQFELMLRIADEPDVRNEASVGELKELGVGFLELARMSSPKPAAEAAPAAPARLSLIVPPAAIQQRLPPWVANDNPVTRAGEFRGAVRVQISAEGRVISAEMVKSVHPAYDPVLLRAARGWLYEPARKDGVPVASEKTVEVSVKPLATPGEPADKSPLTREL